MEPFEYLCRLLRIADESLPIRKALKESWGGSNPSIDDFLAMSDDDIKNLKYTDDANPRVYRSPPRGHITLLRCLKGFAAHSEYLSGTRFNNDNWRQLTQDEFDAFRRSNAWTNIVNGLDQHKNINEILAPSVTIPAARGGIPGVPGSPLTAAHLSPDGRSARLSTVITHTRTKASEFQKSIKIDTYFCL